MPSASRLTLPDCRALVPEPGLSPRQRRELVRLLAEEGPAGLAAWLRAEELKDPTIRDRVARERDKVEREAEARRRRLEADQQATSSAGLQKWLDQQRELEQKEAQLRERLEEAANQQPTADDIVRHSPLLQAAMEPATQGPLRRLWNALRAWLTRLLARPKPGDQYRKRTGKVRLTPELSLQRQQIARLRLQAPEASQPSSHVRSWWRRLLGRGRMRDIQRVLEAEVEAARQAHDLKVKADAAAIQKRLSDLEQDRARQEQAHADEEAETERRQAAQRRRFEEEQQAAPYEQLGQRLLSDLEDAGLADHDGRATSALLERFATQLLDDARSNLPGGRTTPGTYTGGDGDYERGPLVSQHEVGAVELVDSLVRARIRHPNMRHLYDDDLIVHREIRSSTTHVIVVFDTSGSMETGGRLDAAKRVCLMLHRAVAEHSPDGQVDLLQMGTSVQPVDLAACWNAEPQGFTNFGAAFRQARERFEQSGADRRVLYLITDGLPEAWTMPNGRDVADNPEPCMKYAKQEAERLARLDGLHVILYQLETSDDVFVEACRELAEVLDARVEAVEVEQLAGEAVDHLQTELAQPRAA